MKEKSLNKGIIRRSVFVVSLHFLAIDSILKYATIKLLKPPVLTARHGGVLFLK
ncbi:MAG: hypothetical protein WC608_01225 [Parcubacteria group bacterium]